MTAANSLHQSMGAMSFPLSTGSDFEDIDPAPDILLELFAAAINAELLPRWSAAVASTPLWDSQPVQTKLPTLPDADALKQVAVKFPLRAVSRAETPVQTEEFSIDRSKETWRWDVDYLLCPLTIGNKLALEPALTAVGRILNMVIREGGHRAYATQTAQGFTQTKNVFAAGDGCCNFHSIRVVEYRVGAAALSEGGPKYHACSMTLETVELSRASEAGFPAAGSYSGTGLQLRTGTEQGLKTVVVADSAVPLP
jgi:hypothetical protein